MNMGIALLLGIGDFKHRLFALQRALVTHLSPGFCIKRGLLQDDAPDWPCRISWTGSWSTKISCTVAGRACSRSQ